MTAFPRGVFSTKILPLHPVIRLSSDNTSSAHLAFSPEVPIQVSKKVFHLLIIPCLFLLPTTAFASIAYDNSAVSSDSLVSPVTVSYTPNSSNVLYLIQTATGTGGSLTSIACTVGGNSTTLVATADSNGGTTQGVEEFEYYSTSGSMQTVSCSFTGGDLQFVVKTLTGTKTVSPIDSASITITNNNNNANFSLTPTLAVGGEWVELEAQGTADPTAWSNLAKRNAGAAFAYDSNGIESAGTFTTTATVAVNKNVGAFVFGVEPAVSAPTPVLNWIEQWWTI